MAPELLNPRTAYYTTKSDMYSYGITLWEIAARDYPYVQARGSFALIKRWKESGQEEAIPVGTPGYFVDLIERCRCLKPRDRLAASAVIEYLESIPLREREGMGSWLSGYDASSSSAEPSDRFGSLELSTSRPGITPSRGMRFFTDLNRDTPSSNVLSATRSSQEESPPLETVSFTYP